MTRVYPAIPTDPSGAHPVSQDRAGAPSGLSRDASQAQPLIPCAQCGAIICQPRGAINRAIRAGLALYCDRRCAGLARRKNKSRDQRAAEKAAYDRAYREANIDKIKADKRAYFERTYDSVAAAEHRKTRMPAHVEYCRRPEYRKWKAQYDRQHRARKDFGDFGEAAIILNDLCSEIASRSTFYERAISKGTLNKWLERKRDYERQTICR